MSSKKKLKNSYTFLNIIDNLLVKFSCLDVTSEQPKSIYYKTWDGAKVINNAVYLTRFCLLKHTKDGIIHTNLAFTTFELQALESNDVLNESILQV